VSWLDAGINDLKSRQAPRSNAHDSNFMRLGGVGGFTEIPVVLLPAVDDNAAICKLKLRRTRPRARWRRKASCSNRCVRPKNCCSVYKVVFTTFSIWAAAEGEDEFSDTVSEETERPSLIVVGMSTSDITNISI